MPKPKTPQRSYAEKLCLKHPDFGDRTIARMVHKKFPDKTIEAIRKMVRDATGHGGEATRNYKSEDTKKLFKPLEYNYKKTNLYKPDSKEYISAQKRKLSKSKYYIVTWAQNNTPVHKEFLHNIESYAKFIGAEIHVILGRYKNPTSIFQGKTDEHWANEILPYADAKRQKIHKNLMILSDIRVQPTAEYPMTGLESISGLSSCIIGHPKRQFYVVAALEGYEPKNMFTTGAITVDNYTDSKAGKKGEFDHTTGFVIIEIKDANTFFARQVTCVDDGSFSDLCYNVKDGKVTKDAKIKYANMGDIHVDVKCPIVEKQQVKLLDYFKPKHTIVCDVFNGTSVNHHEEKDPIKKYFLQQNGDNLIKNEFERMFKWCDKWIKYNLVFIASNHNDFIDRYIKRMDWKNDIPNSKEYMEMTQILLSGNAPDGIVAYKLKERYGKKIKTIGRNESFRIGGIELSQHGDIGTNGAKGNIKSFKRLSTKMDIQHTHTPAYYGGVMQVGTSTVTRVGYNVGASNWENADGICHENGKRQHIIYMGDNKEFTTFKF